LYKYPLSTFSSPGWRVLGRKTWPNTNFTLKCQTQKSSSFSLFASGHLQNKRRKSYETIGSRGSREPPMLKLINSYSKKIKSLNEENRKERMCVPDDMCLFLCK
jgi:hypothetical protein